MPSSPPPFFFPFSLFKGTGESVVVTNEDRVSMPFPPSPPFLSPFFSSFAHDNTLARHLNKETRTLPPLLLPRGRRNKEEQFSGSKYRTLLLLPFFSSLFLPPFECVKTRLKEANDGGVKHANHSPPPPLSPLLSPSFLLRGNGPKRYGFRNRVRRKKAYSIPPPSFFFWWAAERKRA